ncbi:MAG: DUF4405 domain-containing protein [archaeon]
MNNAKRNYIVDAFLAVSFLVSASIGLLMFFKFPSGEKTGRLLFWGIPRHTWGDIHAWSGIAMATVVLIHLILHWKWIVCMTKTIFKKKSGEKC